MAHKIRDLAHSSDKFGTEKLTIAANRAVGADADCRKVLVCIESGKNIYLGNSVTVDTDDGAKLLATEYTVLEVTNTNLLHFYGDANGDRIYLIYFE